MRSRRKLENIAGRVNGVGTINAGQDDFTVRKAGTGAYSLTFPNGFRLLAITATTGSAAVTMFAGSFTENTCLISTSPATDTFFSFVASGYWV